MVAEEKIPPIMMLMNLQVMTSCLCLALFLSCTKAAKKPANEEVSEIFRRPLIIGASMSANHNGVSNPAQKLAEKIVSTPDIKSKSRGGSRSTEIIAQLDDEAIKDRSIIVGLDLFFWDSTDATCTTAQTQMTTLVDLAKNSNIPLVIAKVPRLNSVLRQPCRNSINENIEQYCSADKRCYILNLEEIYQEISKAGGTEVLGVFRKAQELLPDGLHVSDIGSEMLTVKLRELFR